MAPSDTRAGQRNKTIEERIAYAINHRTRVQILILLNEGTYSTGDIAQIIDEPLKTVSNHIRELLDADSIEVAEVKRNRNAFQHYYRAVEMPFYSDQEMESMSFEQRQAIYGLVIQSMMAEVMAGLWSGKMSADPRTWLSWNWFNVDAQGREEIADEQAESWKRIQEIEVRSTNRCAESDDETVSILVSQTGFERARKATRPSPPTSGE